MGTSIKRVPVDGVELEVAVQGSGEPVALIQTALVTSVLDLIQSGGTVAEVAQDLGVSQQAIYFWLRQQRIDREAEPV